ncbi:MAG TPA: extracellular solute-binding protein [Chloroflexia bacterium]|nr:extracellular solute-binding protein [Chloroflexia bacterium]
MSRGFKPVSQATGNHRFNMFHFSRLALLLAGIMLLQLLFVACGDNTPTTAPATTAASTAAAATTVASAATTQAGSAATTAAGEVATVSTNSPGPTAPPVSTTGGSGKLRILIHQNKPFVDYMNQAVQKFKQQYPNINVELSVVSTGQQATTLKTRLAANDLDLYEVAQGFTNAPQPYMKGIDDPGWITQIKSGVLLDLSNQPFIKNYYANALKDASSYNGGIYQLTTGRYAYSGVFYNKDIFAQNDLKVPTTWDEFVAVCEKLKAKGIAPLTAGGKDVWPVSPVADSGLLLSMYPDQKALVEGLWTGKIKFNDPTAQTYFERGAKYLSYFEKGINQIDYQTAPGRFASGKAAMYPGGTWDAPTIVEANPKINLGYFPFPGADDANSNKTLAGKYDVGWYVPAKGQNVDAALKFLNFFSQPDNYAAYVNAVGILPVQPNVNLTADYAKEIVPYLPTFKVAFSAMMVSPKNLGKYANFSITNLTPIGDVSNSKDLANKAEADWSDALKK